MISGKTLTMSKYYALLLTALLCLFQLVTAHDAHQQVSFGLKDQRETVSLYIYIKSHVFTKLLARLFIIIIIYSSSSSLLTQQEIVYIA